MVNNPFDPGYSKKYWNKSAMDLSADNQMKKIDNPFGNVDVTNLPRHLYTPLGAKSIDIRRAISLPAAPPAATAVILSYTCPQGSQVFFTGYSLFDDGLLAQNVDFIPRVNGSRIFPFHGDPLDNFRINLANSPDLGMNGMIDCQLALNPGQTVTWTVINREPVVAVIFGVRMRGYSSTGNIRTSQPFGG